MYNHYYTNHHYHHIALKTDFKTSIFEHFEITIRVQSQTLRQFVGILGSIMKKWLTFHG